MVDSVITVIWRRTAPWASRQDIWSSPSRTVNALGTCRHRDKPVPFPDTFQSPPWGGGAGQELRKSLTILSGGQLYLLTIV